MKKLSHKEEAGRIYNLFYSVCAHPNSVAFRKEAAKEYALIHIEGVMYNLAKLQKKFGIDEIVIVREIRKEVKWWIKVKEEIESI